MTVGYHSPLPPAATGVADYSAGLMAELQRHVTVRANEFGDRNLYHLGNNPFHGPMYRRFLERPGMVVLHDAVLHHFYLSTLPEPAYVAEFVAQYGAWYQDFAQTLWRARGHSASDHRYFDYPMLARVRQAARQIVVHNRAAGQRAGGVVIPHYFASPGKVTPLDLGGSFTFGVFGYLRETKRILPVMRAFQAVRKVWPGVRLLLAGEFVSSSLARAVAREPQDGVVCLPHTDAETFWRLCASVDAGINLRYPTAAETSAITVRLMGLGKPVVLTEDLSNADYPEYGCVRVPWGVAEQTALETALLWLARSPAQAREMGRIAQGHIQTHHALPRVAEQFAALLRA
jgi:glycosyltransferase involved in cell wall biosynthesis